MNSDCEYKGVQSAMIYGYNFMDNVGGHANFNLSKLKFDQI